MSGCCGDPRGITFDPLNLLEQSIPHPDIPACRVSKYKVDDLPVKTLHEVLSYAVEKYGDQPFLGYRSSTEMTTFDVWLTYSQGAEKVTNIGYGLRWLGQAASNDTLIGIVSKNRTEMALTQFACYEHSMVLVPMYTTLGDEGVEHIVNQTKMQVIFCEDNDKIKLLLKFGKEKLPNMTTIVHIDPVSKETVSAVEEQGWTIHSFSNVESNGKKNPVEKLLCKPEDLCLICYTSGTTGTPKGAMLQHNSVLTASIATSSLFTAQATGVDFTTNSETYLSYLPLAHMYEQLMLVGMMYIGGKVGFFSGSVDELFNDIKYLQPTYFASVPRFFNKIYDRIKAKIGESKLKTRIYERGLEKKAGLYQRGIITKSTIWDMLLFKKVQNAFGGRVKVILTGGAPISAPVLSFLRLAFGALVFEGYGQTEASASVAGSLVGEHTAEEVGPPAPYNMIKLVDVPEMDYYAAENTGEICVHGLNVFRGYLDDEEKTKEALDSDGWLHTGDIGMWTERGSLKIVDRKKNIFKLSQGEYIAPERLENVYSTCSLVALIFVHGDSLKSSLVAVVLPDIDVLPSFARSELGIDSNDLTVLCGYPKVKTAVMESMAKAAKQFNLKGFEQVKDVHLTADAFTVENGLLTPTFKLKRKESCTKYQQVIDEMYSKLD